MGVDELFVQPTNTTMMNGQVDPGVVAQVNQQMQDGLDPINQEDLRKLVTKKKSLYASDGERGLNLSSGGQRGLNMSFNKRQVPQLTELGVPFDDSQVIPPRAPIGSHKGRGLRVGFNKN